MSIEKNKWTARHSASLKAVVFRSTTTARVSSLLMARKHREVAFVLPHGTRQATKVGREKRLEAKIMTGNSY
jgi:hypothetical protein